MGNDTRVGGGGSVQGPQNTGGNGGTTSTDGGDKAQDRGMQALIDKYDTNKDGKLSKEEALKAIQELMKGKEAGGASGGGAAGGGEKGKDLNGDGKVDEKDKELEALMKMLGIDPQQFANAGAAGGETAGQATTH
jgi:hypothetical protein